MSKTKMEKLVSFIMNYGCGIAKFTLIMVFSFILFFCIIPAINTRSKEKAIANTIVSDTTYSFNDTVVMVKYEYSWWGLGGISSTTVTFQIGVNQTRLVIVPPENTSLWNWFFSSDEKSTFMIENYTLNQFTFPSYSVVSVGSLYHVDYRIIRYGDNRTEVMPTSIVQIP